MKVLIILSISLSFLTASITLPSTSGTKIKLSNSKSKPVQVKVYENTYVVDPNKDLIISVGDLAIVLVDISKEGMKKRKVIKKKKDLLEDVSIEE